MDIVTEHQILLGENKRLRESLSETVESLERLTALSRALLDKLQVVQPHIDGAFHFVSLHGGRYTGPTYGQEIEALQAQLFEGAE